jgi:uncharacterized membrane protein
MKKIKYLLFFLIFIFPIQLFAQGPDRDLVFKAEVLRIEGEHTRENEFGQTVKEQKLILQGAEDERKGKEYIYDGIDGLDLLGRRTYMVGDKVLVVESLNDSGEATYYISDYIRNKSIFYLFALFVLALLVVGRLKGLRALVSLTISALVIVYYIIPQILSGSDAVIVSLIGSIAILFSIVYLTEGFNLKSHIASLSILISLLFTVFLSWFFVEISRLSGVSSEEVASLVGIGIGVINFKGLLLAGIIIGTLGVLDDVIISQISTVEQLYIADSNRSIREVFRAAYKVGISHISSMANTLFLAYAGASFPLLILFISGESAYHNFVDVVNNEEIATEIVRTLSGSIGLILAVPIATYLASYFLKKHYLKIANSNR